MPGTGHEDPGSVYHQLQPCRGGGIFLRDFSPARNLGLPGRASFQKVPLSPWLVVCRHTLHPGRGQGQEGPGVPRGTGVPGGALCMGAVTFKLLCGLPASQSSVDMHEHSFFCQTVIMLLHRAASFYLHSLSSHPGRGSLQNL